jgi:hypothetical protein
MRFYFIPETRAESLYIVKSGEIELFLKDTTGQKIVLSVAEKNDLFGELAYARQQTALGNGDGTRRCRAFCRQARGSAVAVSKEPDTALHMLASMSGMLRRRDELIKTRVSRNANEEIDEKLSPIQRVSDWIAWFSGSMQFLILTLSVCPVDRLQHQSIGLPQFDVSVWISDDDRFAGIDFSLLFRAYQPERQVEKDRVRADIEYDVNVKASWKLCTCTKRRSHLRTNAG